MADNIAGQEGFKREPPINAFFNRSEEYISGAWHPFPTMAEALKAALEKVGKEYEPGALLQVRAYQSGIPGLEKHLPKRVDPDELNYLAATLQSMPLRELAIFRGALVEGLYCDSTKALINLAYNVKEWMDAPEVFTDGQLGRFVYDNGLLSDEEYSAATVQLQTSYCPDEHFDALGEAYRLSHGGFFTSYGYAENLGVTEVIIPEESRLFAMADAALMPFSKVPDTDLVDFIMKAHALAGDYMSDAQYNLRALETGQSAYYLLLMDGKHISVMETDMAYYGGTAANSAARLNDGAEVSAFLLHYEYGDEGRHCGSVVAVDYAMLRQDIDEHAVYFTSVEATTKNGYEKSFTREGFLSLELIERDKLQRWVYKHDPADLAALKTHVQEYFMQAMGNARAVTARDILETLNRGYMEQAENPYPDMLRIPQQVAKDMILGGHAPVYRIMPGGPAELGPKDIILSGGGLWYQFYREFAVKKSDMAGLDKWSEASVGRFLPGKQRDAKKGRDERG